MFFADDESQEQGSKMDYREQRQRRKQQQRQQQQQKQQQQKRQRVVDSCVEA